METITFHNADIVYRLKGIRIVRTLIIKLFKQEGKKLEALTVVFCSDNYLLGINQQYLNHDFYTDIITFDLSNSKKVEGELYISIERVRENAGNMKCPTYQEMVRVIVHGALHLCGYKDKNSRDITLMRSKEEEYLKQFLFS